MVVFATPMYYFGFSSQLKAVIDRFYALNGQVKGSEKRSALLMAYADTAAEEAEPMLSHYHTLLRYLGWKDCGTVVAAGMWPAGTEQYEIIEALGSEYQNYNLVMATTFGLPIGDSYLRDQMQRIIDKLGLSDVVFHSLRHTSILV